MNKFDAWLESPYYDNDDNFYEALHEQVCDAIINKQSLSYGSLNNLSVTPFFSNDLGDKLHELSGQVLTAYIQGDNEEIIRIMQKLCAAEIDSIIDLIGD